MPGGRRLRPQPALAAALLLALATAPARAAPQANLGLTVGGAAANLRASPVETAFHLGGRADVLFLRDRNRDFAFGPYLDVATLSFDSLELGGGLELLIPVSDSVPFVLSGGFFERRLAGAWQPGFEATLFGGARSHNFTSWYALANGLFVQGRYGVGDSRQADLIAGVQVDLSFFAYPFLLAYEAVRR